MNFMEAMKNCEIINQVIYWEQKIEALTTYEGIPFSLVIYNILGHA